eukprot:TRINITY_DN1964_c0_g5_i2.p2 TRINITY_DN1964_c0_g5~~TRINITY_DN1964_c0_g5_i2.p2  ORF type:complete len:524 (+),score=132.07 TRINITY_DN1964_c0_g5_i2:66-1574(+)
MAPLFRKLEAELDHDIEKEYKEEDFDPTPVVMRILTASSESHERIDRKAAEFEAAMQNIVEVYHQAFNQSLRSFSDILKTVTSTQQQVSTMKREAQRTRELLTSRRKNLGELWMESMRQKETVRILTLVEEVQTYPAVIDKYLAEKHYLHAAELLVKATGLLRSGDLAPIRALENVVYDINVRMALLQNTLVAELVSFLFGAPTAATAVVGTTATGSHAPPRAAGSIQVSMTPERLQELLTENVKEDLLDRTETSDPLLFVRLVIESLRVCNHVGPALQTLGDAVTPNINRVLVEAVAAIRARTSSREHTLESTQDKHAQNAEPLVKLLELLFDRFLDILRNTSYVLQMFTLPHLKRPHLSRSDGRGVSAGDIKEGAQLFSVQAVWAAVENELKELLRVHFQTQVSVSSIRATVAATSAVGASDVDFSFDYLDAVDQGTTTQQSVLVCEASPYNVVYAYRLLIGFSDRALTLIPASPDTQTTELNGFLDEFVSETFFCCFKI